VGTGQLAEGLYCDLACYAREHAEAIIERYRDLPYRSN
jgi:hypothetical protein